MQKVFQTVSKIHSQVRITETQAGCLIWFPSQRNSKPNHTASSVPRWPGCSMNSRIQDSFKNLRHKGTHIFWPVMFSNCSNELAAHVHELEFLSVKRVVELELHQVSHIGPSQPGPILHTRKSSCCKAK